MLNDSFPPGFDYSRADEWTSSEWNYFISVYPEQARTLGLMVAIVNRKILMNGVSPKVASANPYEKEYSGVALKDLVQKLSHIAKTIK